MMELIRVIAATGMKPKSKQSLHSRSSLQVYKLVRLLKSFWNFSREFLPIGGSPGRRSKAQNRPDLHQLKTLVLFPLPGKCKNHERQN